MNKMRRLNSKRAKNITLLQSNPRPKNKIIKQLIKYIRIISIEIILVLESITLEIINSNDIQTLEDIEINIEEEGVEEAIERNIKISREEEVQKNRTSNIQTNKRKTKNKRAKRLQKLPSKLMNKDLPFRRVESKEKLSYKTLMTIDSMVVIKQIIISKITKATRSIKITMISSNSRILEAKEDIVEVTTIIEEEVVVDIIVAIEVVVQATITTTITITKEVMAVGDLEEEEVEDNTTKSSSIGTKRIIKEVVMMIGVEKISSSNMMIDLNSSNRNSDERWFQLLELEKIHLH